MLVSRIRMATLAAGVAGACALSACGSSSGGSSAKGNGEASKTGPQVIQDAGNALRSADAVHVSGQVLEPTTKLSVELDMQLQSTANSGKASLNGQPFEVVTVGGNAYVKAGAGFYTGQGASAAAASKLAGRWVKSGDAKSFESLTLNGLADDLFKASGDSTVTDKVETGTLDGQDVVIVSQTDGSKFYVAASGQPYPLKAESPKGAKNGSGALVFKDYGVKQDIKAPADAIDSSAGGTVSKR